MYKVGHKTEHGLLLAEAIKDGNLDLTISLYENTDDGGRTFWTLLEWDNSDNLRKVEVDRSIYYESDRAKEDWLYEAFSIISYRTNM